MRVLHKIMIVNPIEIFLIIVVSPAYMEIMRNIQEHKIVVEEVPKTTQWFWAEVFTVTSNKYILWCAWKELACLASNAFSRFITEASQGAQLPTSCKYNLRIHRFSLDKTDDFS